MKSRLLVLWAAFVFAVTAPAAEPARVERDLGQGLAYVRVHALPDDLPAPAEKPRSLVLDLRYVRADAKAVSALTAWLQFRGANRPPLFILVNPETDPAILDYFEAAPPLPGVTLVGPASSRFVPDIAVKVAPATERAAYDALESGATVDSLVTDQPGKVRYDEAAIAAEHAADADDANDAVPDPAAALKPPAPPPLIDATLQRALHLHRALKALRKI